MKRIKRGNIREPFDTVKLGNITVPIYRRERRTTTGKFREVFEVADHTTGHRRLHGFGDFAQAQKKASTVARQLASGDVTAAKMRNSEAASYGRAIELLRPTGLALETVAANYAKAVEILGGDIVIEAANFYSRHRGDQIARKRVADVIVELLAAKASRGKSAAYLNDLTEVATASRRPIEVIA